MNNPVIRLAGQQDIPVLTRLLVNCAESMSQQGMQHWLGVYDEDAVSYNVLNKQVYVLEVKTKVTGCIALGTNAAPYYEDCWPDAPAADFYITQLAISPEAQGQGYGKTLMQFCINNIGDACLQLDAVDHYPALIHFYLSLGFEIIATGIGLGDKRHLFQYKR